ncbi:unnamed protein product [Protopolystoma xenopodis]|uniref:Uncharacterized protein n=1 Tax=Protopolystoma xenopodis TaxID=117903 RepID=A0A448WF14_9PLAT|nr:unnamed protein product [Protopolystoma xenopodis]
MGGASMQIAFEIPENVNPPIEFVSQINLGCDDEIRDHVYRIYVTTFLRYGSKEARER